MSGNITTFRGDHAGFPKKLPCLVCGRLRKAYSPSVRIHAACRKARLKQCAVEFTTLHAYHSTEALEL